MKTGVIFLIGIAVLIVVIVVVLVVVLRKKSSSSSGETTVNITVTNNGQKNQASLPLDPTNLTSALVGQFINSIFSNTKVLGSCSFPNASWNSFSIGGKNLKLTNGSISSDSMSAKLSDFLGSIPDSIVVNADLNLCCDPNTKKACNSCNGELPICGKDGSWTCLPNQGCPADPTVCCPNNKYAACVNGAVSCVDCDDKTPGVDKKACDDKPECESWGRVCSPSGWVCEKGSKCPDPSVWGKCQTCHSTQTPVCVNGVFSCADCGGDTPSCPEDCYGSGITCQDGKQVCEKGIVCPSDKKMQECASTLCPDPRLPVPSCVTLLGKSTISCNDCSKMPLPANEGENVKCYTGSCQGHGWVCTESGWVCKPGVKCPDVRDWATLGCTCDPKTDTQAVCVNNCVSCQCISGQQCQGAVCIGDPQPTGSTTCCPSGNCSYDKISGEYVCCDSTQVCHLPGSDGKPSQSPTCCPEGTVCQNNTCVPACGLDSSGSPVYCGVDETCVMIENLTEDTIGKLKLEYKDKVHFNSISNPTIAYVCVSSAGKCNYSLENITSPASINNYYPCYNFPSQGAVVGYCAERDTTDSQICYKKTKEECQSQSLVWDGPHTDTTAEGADVDGSGHDLSTLEGAQNACISLQDKCHSVIYSEEKKQYTLKPKLPSLPSKGDTAWGKPALCEYKNGVCLDYFSNTKKCSVLAEKDCQTNPSCQWRDVLKTMASSTDLNRASQQIQIDMAQIESDNFGDWCDGTEGKTPFSRVITLSGNDACSWDDCFTRTVQPGIVDVEFDTETKNCVALQTCNQSGGGTTKIWSSSGGSVPSASPNPNTVSLVRQNADVAFGDCKDGNAPPLSAGLFPLPGGKIISKTYKCDGTSCVLDLTGNGDYTDSSCGGTNCSCAPGYVRKADGKCYKIPFSIGDGNAFGACSNTAGPCWGSGNSGCSAKANPCGSGWDATCGGQCIAGESCSCYCYLTGKVPQGHMYCDGNTTWQECKDPNGCDDGVGRWGASSSSGSNCIGTNIKQYCTLPN